MPGCPLVVLADPPALLTTALFPRKKVFPLNIAVHWKQSTRGQSWAAGKSRTRQRLDIALNLALPVLVVIGVPTFSLATLGAMGTRVMFNYYVFDIALWIGVTALLSIALGLIKIRIFHKLN
jgi:hypothetical protein